MLRIAKCLGARWWRGLPAHDLVTDRTAALASVLSVALCAFLQSCARPDFFQVNEDREPRWLLIQAWGLLQADGVTPRRAVDAGYGNGIETLWMLEHGATVYAHDISTTAQTLLLRRVPASLRPQLHLELRPFHQATWPANTDLVFAGLSLPFARPDHFLVAWHKLEAGLNCGGRFAGHLFGNRDSWASGPAAIGGTFLTEAEARALLAPVFDVEFFWVEERDGETASGDAKHWHVFHVIAKKRCS